MVIFYSYPALTIKAMGILPVSPPQIDPMLQHENNHHPQCSAQVIYRFKWSLLLHITHIIITGRKCNLRLLSEVTQAACKANTKLYLIY